MAVQQEPKRWRVALVGSDLGLALSGDEVALERGAGCLWRIARAQSGYLRLSAAAGPGRELHLDLSNPEQRPTLRPEAWAAGQHWRPQPAPGGGHRLHSEWTGLDRVLGAGGGEGPCLRPRGDAEGIAWEITDASGRPWSEAELEAEAAVATEAVAAPSASSRWRVTLAGAGDFGLTVVGGQVLSLQPGAPCVWRIAPGAAQGFVRITAEGMGRVLALDLRNPGQEPCLAPESEASGQDWALQAAAQPGCYTMHSRWTGAGRVLSGAGDALSLQPRATAEDTLWVIADADGRPWVAAALAAYVAPTPACWQLAVGDGAFLAATGDAGLQAQSGSDGFVWQITGSRDSFVRLSVKCDGQALSLDLSNPDQVPMLAPAADASGQYWRAEPVAGGGLTLHSMWTGRDRVLTLVDAGVSLQARGATEGQVWHITDADGHDWA